MRFKQVQFGPKCMCRDFYIAQEAIVPSHTVLYYDCPWSDAGYEGQVVNFEFEYGNNKMAVGKKYTFTVPKHEELSKCNKKCAVMIFLTHTEYHTTLQIHHL